MAGWKRPAHRCTCAEAHFQLGDLLRRMGQGRAAKASFEKYLELAPRGDYAEEARRLVDSLR